MNTRDIYQEVTDRILAVLEQGTVPWHKPWASVGGPYNVQSGRPYRGINVFLLELEGYGDPRWGTYRAIQSVGGQVRRGEHGTRVVLWKPVKRRHEEGVSEEQRMPDYILLRDYVVFNAQQADGVPELEVVENDHSPNERAEEIVSGYEGGPGVVFGRSQAAYSPRKDLVYMPDAGTFETPDAYYSTLFHELTHSTGHEKRLKRIEPALFGSDPYAREELVAEMGAAMLCGLSGVANEDQSAAYIAGWLTALRNDRKLVVRAAAQAQKASDHILGVKFEERQPELAAA